MNEAGLIVEVMWLQGTQYPRRDERPALRELGWVQYQLDNFERVDQVVASDAKIRITTDSTPIHFLVCDQEGNAAVIEFLEGKMVAHKGETLPFTALANNTYDQSLRYLEGLKGFGGDKALSSDSMASLDRFSRAVCRIKEYDKETCGDAVDYAFGILKNVSQGNATQWSIVYDVNDLTIQFKTRKSPTVKSMNLKDFDFSCETPCRVLDIDWDRGGNVLACFENYTMEINKKLVFESWKNTAFLKDTSDLLLTLIAGYPDTIKPANKDEVP
jgi:choloylglycine hydrolase